MSKQQQFSQISEAMRKALRALGETPEQHDAERRGLAAIASTTTTKALPTKTVAQLNKAVFQRRGMSPDDRRLEAARLEAAAQRIKPEIPDSWVIFLGEMECACGARFTNLDFSTPFLRMRRVLSTSPLKLDLSSARYIPAGSEEANTRSSGLRLGKAVEVNAHKVITCHNCFTHAVISSPTAAIGSSPPATTVPSGESISLKSPERSSASSAPSDTPAPMESLVPSGIEGVSWQERAMWERNGTPLDSSYAST